MTTILTAFCIALILSNALTPMATTIGTRLGAMDVPDERKIHANPVPRSGGIVFFACAVMVFLSILSGDYLTGFYFSILGGAVLGFLRYNFNPAVLTTNLRDERAGLFLIIMGAGAALLVRNPLTHHLPSRFPLSSPLSLF